MSGADLLGLAGKVLGGKYRVTRVVGAGGMGVVYEALQEDLGRRVALKVLLPQLAFHSELVARFRREAQAAAALGHPNIVQVTDFGGGPGPSGEAEPAYLVMELLEGQSLARKIEAGGPLPAARVARIAAQVLAALDAAHRAGIVHRDIKPDNVFLVSGGAFDDFVKVVDFGVAKLQDSSDGGGAPLTSTGAMIGTLAYMAPEQAQGLAIDARADLYSVGACMYHMLTGRLPFHAPSAPALLHAVLQQPLVPIATVRPDADRALSVIVERAMSRDPRARFGSADEMRHALAPWTGTTSQPPSPPAAPGPVMITPAGQVLVTPPGQVAGIDPAAATMVGIAPSSPQAKTRAGLWVGLAAAGFVVLVAAGATAVYMYSANKERSQGVWVMNAPSPAPVAAADQESKTSGGGRPSGADPLAGPVVQPAPPTATRAAGAATAAPILGARDAGGARPADPGLDAGAADAKASPAPVMVTTPQGGRTVTIGASFLGEYTREQLAAALAPSQAAFDACFVAAVYETSMSGRDHTFNFYEWEVTAAGKPRAFRAVIEDRTVGLEACLGRVVYGITFPPNTKTQTIRVSMSSPK